MAIDPRKVRYGTFVGLPSQDAWNDAIRCRPELAEIGHAGQRLSTVSSSVCACASLFADLAMAWRGVAINQNIPYHFSLSIEACCGVLERAGGTPGSECCGGVDCL